MNEEFVVSARYETDAFKEAKTDSLVTIVKMTDLDQKMLRLK